MKKYFTKDEIATLKKAETYFYTATKENYKRASTSSLNNLVADIYEKVTGNRVNRNWTCGTCVLNCYKAAGALYYESIRYWEEKDGEETEIPELKGVEEMKESTMEILDLNTDGSEKSENTVDKETEPKPVKKATAKKVAKGRPKKSK